MAKLELAFRVMVDEDDYRKFMSRTYCLKIFHVDGEKMSCALEKIDVERIVDFALQNRVNERLKEMEKDILV